MVQSRHRIEKMRKACSPMLQRGVTLLVGTRAVTNLHAKTRIAQRTYARHMTWDFRCKGDQSYGGQSMQCFHFLHAEGYRKSGLGTQFSGIDIRAFQMYPQYAGPLRGPGLTSRRQ